MPKVLKVVFTFLPYKGSQSAKGSQSCFHIPPRITVDSSPTKIANDKCKKFALPTVKKNRQL